MSVLDVLAGVVALAVFLYVVNKLSDGKLYDWWKGR